MDKILTIIIPTYNMSEYLDTCLKSLIIESNLLEVLIINDGSKDNSLDIAKKYEKKYKKKAGNGRSLPAFFVLWIFIIFIC